jgi:hypothetical protein
MEHFGTTWHPLRYATIQSAELNRWTGQPVLQPRRDLRGFSIAERSELHAKETKEALPVSGMPEPRGA